MTALRDVARVIRSKNAKPFILTIDVLCDDLTAYTRIVDSDVLSAGRIARIYGVAVADVRVIPYPAALAIKITFPREIPAGSRFDSDLLGAQQAVPLLNVDVPEAKAPADRAASPAAAAERQ